MTMLKSMENQRTEELRQRMKEAGCVFDFTVYQLPFGAVPGEAEHRAVLAGLFARIRADCEQFQREVIARHPEYANYNWPKLHAELDQARARKLTEDTIAAMTKTTGRSALYAAFRKPPYNTQLDDQQAEKLFAEWIDVLRLHPRENIEILDWVGSPDENPDRSAWSNYFDDGKEWWGIWCLTVWNPFRHTLSTLAASETD